MCVVCRSIYCDGQSEMHTNVVKEMVIFEGFKEGFLNYGKFEKVSKALDSRIRVQTFLPFLHVTILTISTFFVSQFTYKPLQLDLFSNIQA